jgi:predicted nuclease with TOPRIM domain
MEYYESLLMDMDYLSEISNSYHDHLDRIEKRLSRASKKFKLTDDYAILKHMQEHYKKACDGYRADYLIMSPRRKEVEKILTEAGEIEWYV